jgi:magnesium transporter
MLDIQRLRNRLRKTGLPPGVLISQEDRESRPVSISLIDYDRESYREKTVATIDECLAYRNTPSVTWINIDGNQSTDIVARIGDCYGIHPLVLEDIVTGGQRPKCEDHEEYLNVIIKMIYPGSEGGQFIDEQLSLIIGSNYVISVQERAGDPFNVIRERIRSGLGKVRKMGADYLAYSIMDVIIDKYFVVLEDVGEDMEELEEETAENPTPTTLMKIYDTKRTLIYFRKYIWPLREVVSILNRSDSKLIDSATQFYFRDAYDHVIQLIDSIETYRDLMATNTDIYLSNISNRTNETMKRLTMVATIFMPLSLIAGIGGMSEWTTITGSSNWMISYPLLICGLGIVGLFTYLFFKWKQWL